MVDEARQTDVAAIEPTLDHHPDELEQERGCRAKRELEYASRVNLAEAYRSRSGALRQQLDHLGQAPRPDLGVRVE